MIESFIKNQIEDWAQEKIKSIHNVPGGCIANAYQLTLPSKKFFLKTGNNQNFNKEANGLLELQKANCIHTPKVYIAAETFLLLEWIKSVQPDKNFFNIFGQQFAQMHRYTNSTFGFYENNYIGKTIQPNIPTSQTQNNWLEFYKKHRLEYQMSLVKKNGYLSAQLNDIFMAFMEKLPLFFEDSENTPCLLHGDLWSGNYLVGNDKLPVLIDPAVYYGNREADLAMTILFGGFSPEFYNTYNKTYPLPKNYQKRIGIYTLYHVLNHLNLFGTSYLSQAISIMKSYL